MTAKKCLLNLFSNTSRRFKMGYKCSYYFQPWHENIEKKIHATIK